MFGHHSHEKLNMMVQQLGYKLAGDFTACDTCNAIMSKAKSIPKLSSGYSILIMKKLLCKLNKNNKVIKIFKNFHNIVNAMLSPFMRKKLKNRNKYFTKFSPGYNLYIINKLLSKFGKIPG